MFTPVIMCRHLLLNPFIDRVTVRLRVQASQQYVRDEHTQTRYSRSFVVRDSRWSAHRWLNELNADCAISNRWPTSASSLPSPCSLLPRYWKRGTFYSGRSLPMTTWRGMPQLNVSCSTWRLCRSSSLRVIAAYGHRRANAPCAFSGRVVCWTHGCTINTCVPGWASLRQPLWSHSFGSSCGCASPCFS